MTRPAHLNPKLQRKAAEAAQAKAQSVNLNRQQDFAIDLLEERIKTIEDWGVSRRQLGGKILDMLYKRASADAARENY